MHFLHTGSFLPLVQLFLQLSAPFLQYLHLEHLKVRKVTKDLVVTNINTYMLRPSGHSLQRLQESHPSQDPRQSLQVCEEQELDTDSCKQDVLETFLKTDYSYW